MLMPNRYTGNSKYKYGFQGALKDNEIKGNGNSYSFGARILDPRIGRWLSTDPIVHHKLSPYNAFDNNPIYYVDPDGMDGIPYTLLRLAQTDADKPFIMGGTWTFINYKTRQTSYSYGLVWSMQTAWGTSIEQTYAHYKSRTWVAIKGGKDYVMANDDGSFSPNSGLKFSEYINAVKNYNDFATKVSASASAGIGVAMTAGALLNGYKAFASWARNRKGFTQGIPIINGKRPQNHGKKSVTTKSGDVIKYDKNGFPDFTKHSKQTVKAKVKLTGDVKTDVRNNGLTPADKNHVWHHHQDGKTMMLVPKTVHSTLQGGAAHTGGAAVIKHNAANPNQQLSFPSPTPTGG